MAVYGTLAVFSPCVEDWTKYAERLTFYFAANSITAKMKKYTILLSCVGLTTFRLMHSLALPGSLDCLSYDELVSKVKDHKEPPPSVIVRHFQFNTRNQKPSESISEYIAVLHRAAKHYNYSESLSKMLRDRLACDINNSALWNY